jgi:hypothetical protein
MKYLRITCWCPFGAMVGGYMEEKCHLDEVIPIPWH